MKYTHLTQEKHPEYGCGLLSLANILMDDSIITPQRLEESKTGNRVGQLNKWLWEDGKDLYLDYMYFDYEGTKLPDHTTKYQSFNKGKVMPVIYNVTLAGESRGHFTAGHINSNNTLTLMDSAKTNIIQIPQHWINDLYDKVNGILTLWSITTGKSILMDETGYSRVKDGFKIHT